MLTESSGAGAKSKGKRRSLRKRNRHPVTITLAVVAVALGVGLYVVVAPELVTPNNYPFPCLAEQVVYHVHPYLQIRINSQNVTIPIAIGIHNPVIQNGYAGGGSSSCFEPIHTHDASGVIHIESATNRNYTLNDFFTVWRDTYPTISIDGTQHPVVFNSTNILGFKTDATHKVVLLVDGKPSTQYGSLVLDTLDYCSAATSGSPCTTAAGANPEWNGVIGDYPYGYGHMIVIEYLSG